jgi:hypothetical protein
MNIGKDKFGRSVTYVHANEHIKGQFPFESTEKFIVLTMELGRYLVESHQTTTIKNRKNVK